VILARGGSLHFDFDLAPSDKAVKALDTGPQRGFYTDREWRQRERENLLAALKAANGRVSGRKGAAELLGINANTLASRLRALGLKRKFAE
jgi:transcriptional regulator of acetoin/glycerol metabolism